MSRGGMIYLTALIVTTIIITTTKRKVPYDPHTPNIFDGEEFSRAIRFWTYGYNNNNNNNNNIKTIIFIILVIITTIIIIIITGYDIYSPHRVFVVHNYHESQSDPTHGYCCY